MAPPQTSLFKVFSVGQITSIKCCPLAAHRSDAEGKREKNRGEGVGGTGEEQKRNHVEIAELGRGLHDALSLTHTLSHSRTVRLFLNIIIRGLYNCPRRTRGRTEVRADARTAEKCNGICLEASIWRYVL